MDEHKLPTVELTPSARYQKHKAELSATGIPALEERVTRGLDPQAMLAVREVREIADKIFLNLGAESKKVEDFTEELHVGGIWRRAQDLKEAKLPEVQAWFLLSHACHEVNDHELTMEEYLADVDRIKAELNLALTHPETALKEAIAAHVDSAKGKVTMEDGVAFIHEDAFTSVAVLGEKAGVWRDEGLLFVGADQLDYEKVAQKLGLTKEIRHDDRRNQDVTWYVKGDGVEVKVLYPGFCIVFGGDEELAKELARSGQALAEK